MPEFSSKLSVSPFIPVTQLRGVGPNVARKLAKLDIHSVQDLLFHLPLRYQDRTHMIPLRNLRPGDQVAVEGEVQLTQVLFRGKRTLSCAISDGTKVMYLRFFHFSKAQQQALRQGRQVRCFGEVRLSKLGLEMVHPEYYFIDKGEPVPIEETLTPIYPTTEGLHQLSWRKLTTEALNMLQHDLALTELLPETLLEKYQFPHLKQALAFVHRPPPDADVKALEEGQHPCQQRLAFEELLAHHLSLRSLRQKMKKHRALAFANVKPKHEIKFLANLSFQLTTAQQHVLNEIKEDLAKNTPMMRLVQGDVGSGKTVVAALAALQAVASGYQIALMAPTELLAEQHLSNFTVWFETLGFQVAWLSGQIKGKARSASLTSIASGEASVVVGTHALFQKGVEFHHLALMIIDEQHRFGVHQRLALREKGLKEGCYPHQLVMTATPIPRTLAMSAYADLDCSVIDELPPGRTPVKTVALSNSRRAEVVERIAKACHEKRQVYWVCTLIEESEVLQAQAAENTTKDLKKALSALNIGLIHGRMKSAEKELIMQAFKEKQYDVLVATTVIEVGVDVPNASLMVIENAERLGLSQLHQLRGRVGRGSIESHCVLLYQAPLSHTGKIRLDIMRKTTDGFKIAEKDLEIRGPGEVLGTKQTGLAQMRIANLIRDRGLLPKIQKVAAELLQCNPEIVEQLSQRWLVEKAQEFAKV